MQISELYVTLCLNTALFISFFFMVTENTVCGETPALGMESGKISEDQITSSSFFTDREAWEGRLNNIKYWAPITNTDSWIQVDLWNLTRVSGIITQGSSGFSEWITKLQIQSGSSEDTLTYILQNDDPIVSIFARFLTCCIVLKTLYRTCKICTKMLVVSCMGLSYQHNLELLSVTSWVISDHPFDCKMHSILWHTFYRDFSTKMVMCRTQEELRGLLMSKHIYKCLQSVTPVSKRIISATFHGNPQLTVTSVYVLTECSLSDDKDDFYNDLNNHLEQMKPHNIHLVVGDFNARVSLDSHSIHPEFIGRHCFYDTTNNNNDRLVDLCEEFKLRPA